MMEKPRAETFDQGLAENLLEVEKLTVYNKQWSAKRPVLDGISFSVKRGQLVALVGRSGIGKTLIVKSILGLLDERDWIVEGNIVFYQKKSILCPITGEFYAQNNPFQHCQANRKPYKTCPMEVPSGSYLWTGTDKAQTRENSCLLDTAIFSLFKKKYILKNGYYDQKLLSELRGKKIVTVFQGADTHLNPSLGIGWQIGEAINPQKPWKGTEDEVKRRLQEVKLAPDSLKNYPHQFSQGQRQRIMTAMALGKSDLLICDEPTSALDEEVKQENIDMLWNLRRTGDISSTILITHDRKVIENLFKDDDQVVVMEKRKDRVTIVNPALINNEKESRILEQKDFSWFKKPNKTNEILNQNTIFSIRELSQGYRHGMWRKIRWILSGISFDVMEGEFFGIVGQSGCGKTTLAKSIARLVDDTKGAISYYSKEYECERRELNLVKVQPNGNKPDSDLMRELRREIQLIFQDSASTFNPSMSILELFSETIELLRIKDPNESLTMIKENLFKLKICEDEDAIADILSMYPGELSGGERQRLAIARNFLLNPRLVIADEPFADQDKITQKEIIQMMDRMRKRDGTTFIIISHDLDLMQNICDRIAIMKDGKIAKVISLAEKGTS